MMRDARRISERADVKFQRTEVVWVTLGGVVGMGLMFALGFMLGERAAKIDPPASGASPLAQIESDRAMQDDLRFYDTLTKSGGRRAPRSAPARVDAANIQAQQAESKRAAAAKADAAVRVSVSEALARVRDSGNVGNTAAADGGAQQGGLRARLNAGPARVGDYTVQVSAFQSREEADAFASGLRRKGYQPFIVESSITGRGTWYRVRIGRFGNEDQAKEAKTHLAQADIPAWVLKAE